MNKELKLRRFVMFKQIGDDIHGDNPPVSYVYLHFGDNISFGFTNFI